MAYLGGQTHAHVSDKGRCQLKTENRPPGTSAGCRGRQGRGQRPRCRCRCLNRARVVPAVRARLALGHHRGEPIGRIAVLAWAPRTRHERRPRRSARPAPRSRRPRGRRVERRHADAVRRLDWSAVCGWPPPPGRSSTSDQRCALTSRSRRSPPPCIATTSTDPARRGTRSPRLRRGVANRDSGSGPPRIHHSRRPRHRRHRRRRHRAQPPREHRGPHPAGRRGRPPVRAPRNSGAHLRLPHHARRPLRRVPCTCGGRKRRLRHRTWGSRPLAWCAASTPNARRHGVRATKPLRTRGGCQLSPSTCQPRLGHRLEHQSDPPCSR